MGLLNIDIINKQIAAQLSLPEATVALVNRQYWQAVKQHIAALNPQPINLVNIGILKVSKMLVRNKLLKTIGRYRAAVKNNKFTPERKAEVLAGHATVINTLFKLRNIK